MRDETKNGYQKKALASDFVWIGFLWPSIAWKPGKIRVSYIRNLRKTEATFCTNVSWIYLCTERPHA